MPLASVIVLNFNGMNHIRACLDSVLTQEFSSYEVIFIDNASSDGSAEFVRGHYDKHISTRKLRIVVNSTNTGFAEGNNIGYRVAKGKYVVLLNNDAVVRKSWLQELITPLERYSGIGLVGSPCYAPGQWRTHNAFMARHMIHTMSLGGEATVIPGKRQTYHEPHLENAFFVSGNGVAMRKSLFDVPFDADYFAYAEDTYLGWRTLQLGYDVIFSRRASMMHIGGSTRRASGKAFNALLFVHGYKNQMMNHLLFYEWSNVFKMLPFLLLTHIGHIIDNPRKIWAELRAALWIMARLGKILHKRKVLQAARKVPDAKLLPRMSCAIYSEEIAQQQYNVVYRFLLYVLNVFARMYCRLVRISAFEVV